MEEAQQKLVELQAKKDLRKVLKPFKPHKFAKLKDLSTSTLSRREPDATLDGIVPSNSGKKRLGRSAVRKAGCHDDPDSIIDVELAVEGLPTCHARKGGYVCAWGCR